MLPTHRIQLHVFRDVDINHGVVILGRPANVVLDNISLRELAWYMSSAAFAYQPTVVRVQFVRYRMRYADDLRSEGSAGP